MDSNQSTSATEPRHPIGVVSRRTGLKQDLIRAWERRYDAVEPARSDNNRRLYSDADIDRLNLLRRAVAGGRSIGQVAELPDDALEELISEDRAAVAAVKQRRREPPQEVTAAPPSARAESVLEVCLAAVRRLDGADLENQLRRAAVDLGRTALLERVLAPLLEQIGELWRQGELRPIHEHLATATVRSLGATLQGQQPAAPAPRLLVTTPAGQVHEVGALLAAATAATEGWRVTYLGTDLPAEEIAAAARQVAARAVALSITYPPDDPRLGDELRRLQGLLDDSVALLVGGRAADSYEPALQGPSTHLVEELSDLRELLEALRKAG